MKLFIASDHAGLLLKQQLIQTLSGFTNIEDFGTHKEESCSYSEYAKLMLEKFDSIQSTKPADSIKDFGILICGSGIGMSMIANRYKNVRAALCHDIETAKLTRLHNNANILCLAARKLDLKEAINMIHAFIQTDFEGGRHSDRLNF